MLHLQNDILEMVATGRPLIETMDRLCLGVEALLNHDVICSVLTVDQEGLLHPLSAPSLPASYSAALDGVIIGPNVGACGAAAYHCVPVAVVQFEGDPTWAKYMHFLRPLNLNACWSSPIFSASGRVLGTFALYFCEGRGPTEEEQAVVATCLHLSMIALDREAGALESHRLANVDSLTSLSNRACFNRALSGLSCEEPGEWAILVLDLDNLKVTNDIFGHQAGDELLRVSAARLTDAIEGARAYRLGGDEFAVIVQQEEALRDIDAFAQKILDGFEGPVLCNRHLIQPRATIGGAIFAADDLNADSVHQKADFALYHAKETGRGGFVRYWPGIGTAITRRLTAIHDVNLALRENRIQVYYQPIIDLEAGRIVGAEALCRLVTLDGEVISAGQFYEATTDAHVACALTECVLAQVVPDVRRWMDLGMTFQHIGINVSYADIHRGKLGARLAHAFSEANIPLDYLFVEITEDVYMGRQDHVIAHEVAAMRALGLRVALDDFGTGFASLTHLLTVPVDVIKIDKSFVDRLEPGNPSSVIVHGLLSIAQKLGIAVIAEGIEHICQLEQLTAYGCRLGQGYLFSEAIDRDAMTALLQSKALGAAGREEGMMAKPVDAAVRAQDAAKGRRQTG